MFSSLHYLLDKIVTELYALCMFFLCTEIDQLLHLNLLHLHILCFNNFKKNYAHLKKNRISPTCCFSCSISLSFLKYRLQIGPFTYYSTFFGFFEQLLCYPSESWVWRYDIYPFVFYQNNLLDLSQHFVLIIRKSPFGTKLL